jgi:hypothetical protein
VADDYISDDEQLYRNVRGDPAKGEFYVNEITGHLKITSQAFLDRENQKPSVDRAKLVNFNPKVLRLAGSGIVTLIAEEVRQIGSVKTEGNGIQTIAHHVDVMPDPEPTNPAHALIIVDPDYLSDPAKREKAFKLLRRALAKLATNRGWTLKPNQMLIRLTPAERLTALSRSFFRAIVTNLYLASTGVIRRCLYPNVDRDFYPAITA